MIILHFLRWLLPYNFHIPYLIQKDLGNLPLPTSPSSFHLPHPYASSHPGLLVPASVYHLCSLLRGVVHNALSARVTSSLLWLTANLSPWKGASEPSVPSSDAASSGKLSQISLSTANLSLVLDPSHPGLCGGHTCPSLPPASEFPMASLRVPSTVLGMTRVPGNA